MVAAPALKNVGALNPHNTSDTSCRKQCKKDGFEKPLHDEGDDSIPSHQKFMFSVQSHLGQEEGHKKSGGSSHTKKYWRFELTEYF